jgi:hypothetical protein
MSAVFQLVDAQPKTWSAFKKKKDTLVTRYHEGKRLIEEEAIRERLKRLPLAQAAKELFEIFSALDTKKK